MDSSQQYLPVDLDFIEKCKNHSTGAAQTKIHYFEKNAVEQVVGPESQYAKTAEGEFMVVSNTWVRLDLIITLNGRPGPAYEAYDRFANACLTCEDLGQF